jgi:ubiquinone/menaquinone biosynthesis C-methylase UbiE
MLRRIAHTINGSTQMVQLKLTIPPAYCNEYDQPCYPTHQDKGLYQHQTNDLIAGCVADGYMSALGTTLHRWITRQVAVVSAERKVDLVEIGGGRGSLFEWVKDSVHTYINVDPGTIILRERDVDRLKDPRYACIKCSAEEIPLEDESIDVVISTASLDHVPDYRKALAEVSRLLKNNGVFILTINSRSSWWKVLLSSTDYVKQRENEIAREHYFQWSFQQCESNLSEFFSLNSLTTTTFIPFIPRIWKYLLPISDLLGERMLPNHGANILAVCQKR